MPPHGAPAPLGEDLRSLPRAHPGRGLLRQPGWRANTPPRTPGHTADSGQRALRCHFWFGLKALPGAAISIPFNACSWECCLLYSSPPAGEGLGDQTPRSPRLVPVSLTLRTTTRSLPSPPGSSWPSTEVQAQGGCWMRERQGTEPRNPRRGRGSGPARGRRLAPLWRVCCLLPTAPDLGGALVFWVGTHGLSPQ